MLLFQSGVGGACLRFRTSLGQRILQQHFLLRIASQSAPEIIYQVGKAMTALGYNVLLPSLSK